MRPNQYAATATVSSTGDSYQFGFRASYVKVSNDGPRGAFLSFRTSTPTTNDSLLTSGDSFNFTAIMADQLSVIATSSGGSVRILALG